jgi:hypothetical protein
VGVDSYLFWILPLSVMSPLISSGAGLEMLIGGTLISSTILSTTFWFWTFCPVSRHQVRGHWFWDAAWDDFTQHKALTYMWHSTHCMGMASYKNELKIVNSSFYFRNECHHLKECVKIHHRRYSSWQMCLHEGFREELKKYWYSCAPQAHAHLRFRWVAGNCTSFVFTRLKKAQQNHSNGQKYCLWMLRNKSIRT